MAESLQKEIRRIAESGPLTGLRIFQINEYFLEIEEEGYWIFDGGLELLFPAGPVSLGWNAERELYTVHPQRFHEAFTQGYFYEPDSEELQSLERFKGKQANDIQIRSTQIEVIVDWTMATEQEEMVVELLLDFPDNDKFQCSLVNFTFDEETGPSNFVLSPVQGVLVSHGEPVPIPSSR